MLSDVIVGKGGVLDWVDLAHEINDQGQVLSTQNFANFFIFKTWSKLL